MDTSLQTDLSTQPGADAADESPAEPFVLGAGIDFTDPHSRLAPFYCRFSHVAAVVLLGGFFVLMSHLAIWHTDVWGHMRFGEAIVQQRQLPTREVFSGPFADQDALYVNYQWLAQAGAYLVFEWGRALAAPDAAHRLGGGALLLAAAHALIVTLRLVLLLIAFRRVSGSLPFALLGVFLVFVMGMFCHLFILRPQILGELGFAALLLALSQPVLARAALVWVPLVFVAWANAHGSFPMGFVVLGLAWVGQGLAVVGQEGRPGLTLAGLGRWLGAAARALGQDAQMRRLSAVIAISLAAVALLNPHGPALFYHSWKLSNHANIQFMEEWKALPLKSISGFMFLGSVLLLVVLLRWSPLPFTPTQVLFLAAFGWQALAHSRVLVWWIMVFAWIAVPHLHAVYQRYLPRLLEDSDVPSLKKTLVAGLLAVVLLLWSGPAQWFCWGDAPVGPRRVTAATPLAASAYLKSQYRKDPTLARQIFASETAGDYLLWDLRLDPPVHLSCYTHVHLFTPEHWRDCMLVKAGDPGWQEVLDRHRYQYLVVEPDLHSRLVGQVRAAPERWQVISSATDPVFVAKRRAHTP